MKDIKVFVDSDVVISSLLSKTGAAYLLINSNFPVTKYVSNLSITELKKVIAKLNIENKQLNNVVTLLNKVTINKDSVKKVPDYVHDKNDAHIVAGAIKAKVKFLITYNTKD